MESHSNCLNRVLLVDDDPAMLRLLEVYLQTAGYEVCTASSGAEAIDAIQVQQPAFLITDWEMPGISGIELCKRVRALSLNHYLYILILTGRSGQSDIVTAMDSGADDFLMKPIHKHELLARLTGGARVLRLESRLTALASSDSLTGLMHWRPFGVYADQLWRNARINQSPLTAVMLDVDFFKRVNDTYGHAAGDAVLCDIAQLLQSNAPENARVCRRGGEEFCVLLPGVDEIDACDWADGIREAISRSDFSHGERRFNLTVSLGVAEMLAEIECKDELIELADQCLLFAKEHGRNRVVSTSALVANYACIPATTRSECLVLATARDAMIPMVHAMRPDWSLIEAAKYFLEFRVSGAPVIDSLGNLIGVLAEKDLLASINSARTQKQSVEEIMSKSVISYDIATPLHVIYQFLNRGSVRSVVVTQNGRPCGMITRAAFLRWFVSSLHNRSGSVAEADSKKWKQPTLSRISMELSDEVAGLQRVSTNDSDFSSRAETLGRITRMQLLLDDLLSGSTPNSHEVAGIPF